MKSARSLSYPIRVPPVRQKTALLLLADTQTALGARQVIEEMGHRCETARNPKEAEEFLRAQAADLLLCTIRDKTEDFRLLDLAQSLRPDCRSVAFIDESLEEYFPELALRAYPYNLIADNGPLDLQELTATLQKLLSEDIFGIEKYKVSVHESLSVARRDQKYDIIERVKRFFLDKLVPERIVGNVELILNELLMNALLAAPPSEGSRGAPSDLLLRPEEQPEVRYGLSDERLAVSVSDPFGLLKKDTFFLYVHRCFAQKSPKEDSERGSGMGLFLVFKSLNQLVINVARRRKTEVIALIDPRFPVRELKRRHHSFNYFHIDGV